MDAAEIVSAIGRGVRGALSTNELFLGVEVEESKNPDIHPEYVTTVKVGEALTGPDRLVSLEAHMKLVRWKVQGLVNWATLDDPVKREMITNRLRKFKFGKKDSSRLDILVLDADDMVPPLLMIEAKLGVKNLGGVLADVNRILRLLDMLETAEQRTDRSYGAVVFHSMEEETSTDTAAVPIVPFGSAQPLLDAVEAHLVKEAQNRPWLKFQLGLLASAERTEPKRGYLEVDDDGAELQVFAKHGFRFLPGLVLLGSAADVTSVTF